MFDRRLVQNFDYLLLGLVLVITAMGLVNLYSAGYNRGEGTPLYIKQIYWLTVGLTLMVLTLFYDYRHLEKLSYPVYVISILMLVAVMVGGKMVYGSRRWLPLGPLAFQPAELAKIAIILALATYFNRRPRLESMRLKDLLGPGLLVLIPVGLIIKQPDLGSGILVALVAGSMILFVGVNWRTLMGLALTLVLCSPVIWGFLKDYQRQRVLTFLDPWKDPRGHGYQTVESLLGFGAGGTLGVGLGESRQKLFFLPEAHTDFIYAVIAEEAGLIGTVAILALFLAILWRGYRIARRVNDTFLKLCAMGFVLLLVVQAMMNMGVVLSLAPNKGIPLPFISFGPNSLIASLICLGLLLAISKEAGSA